MDKQMIALICYRYNINSYVINEDLRVDVNDDVRIVGPIDKLPLQFGKVSGLFSCSANSLTTLEGCPEVVGGYFDCSDNNLTSLVGCPKEVGGSFYCDSNPGLIFDVLPNKVMKNFTYTAENDIKSNINLNILFEHGYMPDSIVIFGGIYDVYLLYRQWILEKIINYGG